MLSASEKFPTRKTRSAKWLRESDELLYLIVDVEVAPLEGDVVEVAVEVHQVPEGPGMEEGRRGFYRLLLGRDSAKNHRRS